MLSKRRIFKEPPEAKLLIAVMWKPGFEIEKFISENLSSSPVSQNYGEIDYRSGAFDFTQTHYYDKEMGVGLKKEFLSFNVRVPRERLVEIKHALYDLEEKFLDHDGGRQVNLDPMILGLESLVIATSKNFPHRVYLRDGVYGDLNLIWRSGVGFDRLPWTYQDYYEHREFFSSVRDDLF